MRRSTQLGESLNGLVKPLAVVGVAAVLLLLEPDFGATVVLGATASPCCSSVARGCAICCSPCSSAARV